MSENNNKNKKKKKTKLTFFKSMKIFIILLLMIIVVAGGSVAGIVISIVKDSPEIDPTDINTSLDHTSFIYDNEGNLIEKIESAEFRTYVALNKMPVHLRDAFIAIEDERFYDHIGVDPKGIIASAMENFKAGSTVRGGSTITQQLVKNVYLAERMYEKTLSRKITEAYLALQVDKSLHKDQILEAYLNRNFFGQNAYGVQEAAQTYFSKDVGELTIAESALFAGVVKSTNQFQPFIRVHPENYDSSKHYQVGEADILGERYILVFNEDSVARQKLVLKKMYELGKINEKEYNDALKEDIKGNLKPGQKKFAGISSYFTDYVKTQAIDAMVNKLGYSRDKAQEELFTNGLKIYSTIDVKMQKELENVYDNFTEILVGNTENIKGPVLVDWRLNKAGNVLDDNNNIIYYKQENIFTDDFYLIIEKDTYNIENNNITIKNNKLTPYPKHLDVGDYYTIDNRKNLVTHTVGSIVIPEGEFIIGENKEITIKKDYLDKNEDFYKIDENENLLINEKFFFRDKEGIAQPQSATVVLDYRNGQIKALVGGRDVEGNRILNRATDSLRHPGSAIKPISVYLPALDNGYTAASPIDDIPYYVKGDLWPKNVYTGYRGIYSLRRSVEESVNVNSVKTLDDIGVSTSMAYLEKLGIIDKDNPENDSFVSRFENKVNHDEDLAPLALGGMTRGLTPLEVTAAFGAIANDGIYIEPIAFTKILDRNGNVLIDNIPKETIVTSPQVSYIMKDILRTTVINGFVRSRANIPGMAVAGKTGTTQNQADIWFVGFTPYYVSGVWIGNDAPKITLTRNSLTAVNLWQHIMTKMHEDLESNTSFSKPEGIVSANICSQSGLLPSSLCSHDPRGVIRSEIFAFGTVPKTLCDVHVELSIDTSTGKIANEYCPEELVQQRVFVQRTPPYNPEDNNGIVPSDYQYNAPTAICDEHNEFTIIEEEEEEEEIEEENGENPEVENGDEEPVIPSDPLDEDNDD